jgi:hypothetical protein
VENVKIRYIGPLTEGVWLAHSEVHGAAFDFEHHEHVDHDGFVEVPAALARDLLGQLEPVPPGEPVVVATTEGGDTILEVPMRPIWELEPGVTLPDLPAAKTETDTDKAKPARSTGRGGRSTARN